METVEITDLDHQGRGIGRIQNKIVFIPNTIPGEIVNIHITQEKKNYLVGRVDQFVKKSPSRQEFLCPYYPLCGGCQILHLPYAEQLIYKENKVHNIFKRYHVEVPIKPIIGSPKPFGYRNKVTFQNENGKLGFYEEETHRFIEIKNCLLLDSKINENIIHLPKHSGKVVVRSNQQDITFDHQKKVMHNIVDFQFMVSLDSFFQINDAVTELLYQKVKEYLQAQKTDTVLDLYCGIGTIGIFVSRDCKKVIGIEISKEAIENAKENAKLNHIPNITFICGDAGKESKKLKEDITSIIIDPPRSGLNQETLETILTIHPKKIVYVSCDPMTLVRDVNLLKEYYHPVEVTPFDMFPNTYHVENVCLLMQKSDTKSCKIDELPVK